MLCISNARPSEPSNLLKENGVSRTRETSGSAITFSNKFVGSGSLSSENQGTGMAERRLNWSEMSQVRKAIRLTRKFGRNSTANDLAAMLLGSNEAESRIRIDRFLLSDVKAERRDGYIVLNENLFLLPVKSAVFGAKELARIAFIRQLNTLILAGVLCHEMEHETHHDGPYNFITIFTRRPEDEKRALNSEIRFYQEVSEETTGFIRANAQSLIEIAQSEIDNTWNRALPRQAEMIGDVAIGGLVFGWFWQARRRVQRRAGKPYLDNISLN